MNEEKEELLEDDGSGVKLSADDIFANWQVHESDNHEKSRTWFVVAGLIFALMLAYSFYTANFFFAVILVIVAVIVLVKDNQETNLLDIYLTHRGVKVGKRFHDFDKLKRFSIIYKPDQNKKVLLFEFKNTLHPEMIIPLEDANPLPIRENLLKYLEEDLERDDIPTTETLNRLLKL